MRKLAVAGALASMVLLSTTIYLGLRLHGGDQSIKSIHLMVAASATVISLVSHALALLAIVRSKSPS